MNSASTSQGRLDPLISLTYLSTATEPFSESELTELLTTSRAKNHAAGLTGMLLYAGGHFIQTLEGRGDDVDAAFGHIERDQRHRDVIVALREPARERRFADWSMGFEELTIDEAAALPGFNDYLESRDVPAEIGRDLGRAGVFHRVFRDKMR